MKQLERRLLTYSAVLGTISWAGASVAAPQEIAPQTIYGQGTDPYYINSLDFDLNNDANVDFNGAGYFSSYGSSDYLWLQDFTYNSASSLDYNQIATTGLYGPATMFSDGDVIGPLTSWSGLSKYYPMHLYREDLGDGFLKRGFMGVYFDIPGDSPSPHYACIDIEIADENNDGSPDFIVHGGLYEDQPDTEVQCARREPEKSVAIPVGNIILPLSLSLLAMGAMAIRRRRHMQ